MNKDLFRMRPFTWVLAAILAALLGLIAIGCFMIATPYYKGAPSDHFDGRHFFNNEAPIGRRGFGSFFKWMWTRKPGPWLDWIANPPAEPLPERVGPGELRVTFVGHSTVLIQMDGLNILTDPFWSERIGPVGFIGPKRHRAPGVRFEDLPPIDVVLIGHNHYDHMDMPTLERLAAVHHPLFLTGLGNAALLTARGIDRVREMDWWQNEKLAEDVTANFVPARHFSGRGLCDRNRSLWGGFVIQGPAGTVYFSGDTGMGPQFEEIRKKFGRPRLALLPIGAFRPRWFMGPVHLSPDEAVEAHQILGAGTSLAVHFGTLRLGDDGQFEPVEELFRSLGERGVSAARFWVLEPGQGRAVPHLPD